MFCLVVKQLDEETHDSFRSRNWIAHDAKLSTESTLGAVTWCSTEMQICIWHSTEMQGLSWHSTEAHVCIWCLTEMHGLYMVFYRDAGAVHSVLQRHVCRPLVDHFVWQCLCGRGSKYKQLQIA